MTAIEKFLRLISGALAFASLLTACATAQVRDGRATSVAIDSDESMAILVSHSARDLEKAAVRCISSAVTKTFPFVRIVSADEFRRAAFPDLPADAAPHSAEFVALLMNDPRFLQRIAPLRLRYLISVSGATEQSVVGAGGGGPAGLVVWNRSTRLSASVLDLKREQAACELSASVAGNPWMLIVGGLPLGIPSMTESQACEELGRSVTKFLETGRAP